MRRALSLLLAAAMLLSAAGCAALFDTEVYSEEAYEAQSETVEMDDDADAISNYASLRRAISRLVAEHAESAELQFQNYDGTISQDISTACWEVKSSTALGAFAVDYISYDLSRIVSYYQAELYITYKRSEYQVSALEQVENLSGLRARLEDAVRAGETYVVMELTAATLAADAVERIVEQAYYADPQACPVRPVVDAAVYPETGVTRIVEAALDYGMDGESLRARRAELDAAVADLAAYCLAPEAEEADGEDPAPYEDPETDPVPEDGDAGEEPAAEEPEAPAETAEEPAAYPGPEAILRALCGYLAEYCGMDAAGGDTAWDALAAGSAGSEGVAMAVTAVCQALDIPCRIVFGRLEGAPHDWNIVTIDEASYHLDASNWEAGEEQTFLAGDEDLWGAYWWDTSEYPACPARYGAEAPSGEPASGEPSEAAAELPEGPAETETEEENQ